MQKLNPVVIVIDDDPAVLNSLKFSLEIEGFSVRCYRSAAEVIGTPDIPPAGCLVIDYYLPDMNGLELLGRLRERGIWTKPLLITSHPSLAVRKRAADMGATIIEKPLLGNLLLDAIRATVAHQPPR
jgi:FixJ family two-component response regulator